MKIDINFSQKKSDDYAVYIDEPQPLKFEGKVAVVTNPKVAGLHLNRILERIQAKECYVITVPDGEKYKTLETVQYILDRLFDHQLDRKSTLIALGGGVIGDMTGFVASIYQRGIDFIQIPTTLLSQVDASVGGKTGVNSSYGKNLIGAFHQPSAVFCETEFLKTLPSREFNAGVAEMIKMAVMFDASFFSWLEKADFSKEINLREAIAKCVELKAKVVAQDEKEEGIRAVLNYGHTFAHVIEKETNYEKYLHGEAVAIGMNMANCLAMKLGLMSLVEEERVNDLLQKYKLPTRYIIKNTEQFFESFLLDKKSSNKKITFILPDRIGGYAIRTDIDKNSIIEVLEGFAT